MSDVFGPAGIGGSEGVVSKRMDEAKMKRVVTGSVLALLALAACTPSVPDSGQGVGFQDYNSYMRNNTGVATGAPMGTPTVTTQPQGFDPNAASAAFDRAEGVSSAPLSSNNVPNYPTAQTGTAPYVAPAPVSGTRPRGNAPAGIKEETGEMAHINPAISDENDFNAVAQRETIESDAERIARNRAQYVVVQPKDLPQRVGDTGPNLAQFALATTHAPGVQMYKRSGRGDSSRACAKYASPDLAQQAFLAKGGPDKDRLGVDPDGDGFACGWDPRPFRAALQ